MARCVVLALAVLVSGLHPAWGQTRAVSAQSPRPQGGYIREMPPGDPGGPRSRSGLRFEPRHTSEPFPAPRGPAPFGFSTWWLWDVVIPAPFRVSPAATTPLTAGPLGGLQLDVQPWRAQVYVDGAYAGDVAEFSGYYRHLSLTAGPHVVTIVAEGHEPLLLEVFVSPGQTLTYRGSLAYAPR